MSDEKEKELKERMVLLERVTKESSEILNQLATLKEELDREKRSKELEEKRLEDKVHKVVRLEQKLAELKENQKQVYQEIEELERQLHFKN